MDTEQRQTAHEGNLFWQSRQWSKFLLSFLEAFCRSCLTWVTLNFTANGELQKPHFA